MKARLGETTKLADRLLNVTCEGVSSPKPLPSTGASVVFAAVGSRSRPTAVGTNGIATNSTNILIENHVKRVTSASKRRLVLRNNN